jgi:hypothetical protein
MVLNFPQHNLCGLIIGPSPGSDIPAPLAPFMLAQAIDLPSQPDYDTPSANRLPSPSGSATKQETAEKKISKWLKMGPSRSPSCAVQEGLLTLL